MKVFTVIASVFLAFGATNVSAEAADRNKPIEIVANAFLGDELQRTAIYTGEVTFDQGTMHMTGERLEMQETAKGYRLGTLTGNRATFRQKRDAKYPNIEEWMHAQAKTIVYNERTGIVTLTGDAVVERRENGIVKDRATGSSITYDTIRSRTIIKGQNGGRATTVIAPRARVQSQNTGETAAKLNSASTLRAH